MAIFSRRDIQKALDNITPLLSPKKSKALLGKLNKRSKQSIETEWEVIITDCLNKEGKVDYEKDYNGKEIDITFRNSDICFIADITTVSDKGYEEKNSPIAFINEFHRILKKNGLNRNHFNLNIGNAKNGSFSNHKIILLYPRKIALLHFNQELETFLQNIKNNPLEKCKQDFYSEKFLYSLNVGYNPECKNFSAGYLSYNVPYSIENNPLYNRLQTKYESYKKIDATEKVGIILCDAGCGTLSSKMNGFQSYSKDKIISHFLLNQNKFAFVIVISTSNQYGAEIKGYALEQADVELSNKIIYYISKNIPNIYADSSRALQRIESKSDRNGRSNYKGLFMSDRVVKISSRMLLDLLAGKISQEQFLDMTGFKSFNGMNVFQIQTNQSRLIKKLSVEPSSEDDDLVVFEFDEDPALADFKINPKKLKSS